MGMKGIKMCDSRRLNVLLYVKGCIDGLMLLWLDLRLH